MQKQFYFDLRGVKWEKKKTNNTLQEFVYNITSQIQVHETG